MSTRERGREREDVQERGGERVREGEEGCYFQISNIKNIRAKMRLKSCHISSPRPFSKMRIRHNANQYFSKGLVHPKAVKYNLNTEFEGIGEVGPAGWDIPINRAPY